VRHSQTCAVDNVVVLPTDSSVVGEHRHWQGLGGGAPAGQARAHTPFSRVRPLLTRVRRFIDAHRVRSQASFLRTPRYRSLRRWPFFGRGPGDDPLNGRAGGIVLLELRGAGPGAGGPQQLLVRVDGHRTAVLRCGAPGSERATGAYPAEGHRPLWAHRPAVPGGAGDGATGLVDREVVEGESAVHGRAQRFGLDHRVVPGGPVDGTGSPVP